ncbi:MAG: sulfite exporter TauE/SafE family protein, partial [Ardenticatenaceae bacterium]
LTGLTAGGLSCVAVQGGLLATTIARREQLLLEEKSQSTGHATPILLFLGAKLVAYTLLGALLGLLGSWISLSPTMRGWLQILIGLFMLGMALQMLDIHPIFRYLVIQPPKRIQRFIRQSSKADDAFTPLFLGALTVFIPCGVTQAMELLALGSGSATQGALIMFAFVLGTSPIFYLLGLATARLSSAWEGTFMRVAATTIAIMALYSILGGTRLLGVVVPTFAASDSVVAEANLAPTTESEASNVASDEQLFATSPDLLAAPANSGPPTEIFDTTQPWLQGGATGQANVEPSGGIQEVTINVQEARYVPERIQMKAGVPARLTLITDNIYTCARAFVIPAFNVQKLLPATGSEVVEFTPTQPGKIPFMCSMGMYGGFIEVVP